MLNIPQNDTGGEKLSFSEPSTLQAQIKKTVECCAGLGVNIKEKVSKKNLDIER